MISTAHARRKCIFLHFSYKAFLDQTLVCSLSGARLPKIQNFKQTSEQSEIVHSIIRVGTLHYNMLVMPSFKKMFSVLFNYSNVLFTEIEEKGTYPEIEEE